MKVDHAPTLTQKRWANRNGMEAAPRSALFRNGGLLVDGFKAGKELAARCGAEYISVPTGKDGDHGDRYLVGKPNPGTLEEVYGKADVGAVLKAIGRCTSPGIMPTKDLSLRAKVVSTRADGHTFISEAVGELIGKAYDVESSLFKVNSSTIKALLAVSDESMAREYGELDLTEADMFIDANCIKEDVELGEVILINFENVSLHNVGEAILSIGQKRLGFQFLSWLTPGEYDRLFKMAAHTRKLVEQVSRLLLGYFTVDPMAVLEAITDMFPDGERVQGEDGGEKLSGDIYHTVDSLVARCHGNWVPRLHNYAERGQLDSTVEACIRKLTSGLYVKGIQAWAISSSDLKPGEVRLPAHLKGMPETGTLMRYPIHGRSSMRNSTVVGSTDGPWIEVSHYDLQACMDGDSDGDIIYFIPGFTLSFDTVPEAGGIKAKAKEGVVEAQSFDSLVKAAKAKADASAQIGIAVDAAYVFMQHQRNASPMGLTWLFAQWMEATASIAAKDGAAAPKWGTAEVEAVRNGLIGDKNFHSPSTALVKALCSRKHRLATECNRGWGITYGVVEYKKERERDLGRLAQLLRQLKAVTTLENRDFPPVAHLQWAAGVILPFLQRASPERVLKRSKPVYQQAALLSRRASTPGALALHKGLTAFSQGRKEGLSGSALHEHAVAAVRLSWRTRPFSMDGFAHALGTCFQDPYGLKAAGLFGKALFVSTAFVNALHDASDGKLGLPGAAGVDFDWVDPINKPRMGVGQGTVQIGLVRLEEQPANTLKTFLEVDEDKQVIARVGQDPITGLWTCNSGWLKNRVYVDF